jgi:DNA gyrase subunit A
MVKKTEFKAYDTPIKADGIIAINIKKGDELVEVRQTSGKDDIIMVSKSGHAARFNEKLARPMGRGTAGVKGMNVSKKGNEVLSLEVAKDEDELDVVTENGYGKRTAVSDYPVKGRGTQGVLTIKLTEKKGGLAGAMIVRDHQDLIFISQTGMVQRTSVTGINLMGRSTQGVRVMNLKKGDRVSAVALVVESTNGNGASAETNGASADEPAGDLAAEEAAVEEAGEDTAAVKVAGEAAKKAKPAPKAKKPPPKAKPAKPKPKKPPPKRKG